MKALNKIEETMNEYLSNFSGGDPYDNNSANQEQTSFVSPTHLI
jgi:hypothetical protein